MDNLAFELKKLCNRALQEGNQRLLYPGSFVQCIPSKCLVANLCSYSHYLQTLYGYMVRNSMGTPALMAPMLPTPVYAINNDIYMHKTITTEISCDRREHITNRICAAVAS